MGSNGQANFVIRESQFHNISLLRDTKCTESYGLSPGIVKPFLARFLVVVGFDCFVYESSLRGTADFHVTMCDHGTQ